MNIREAPLPFSEGDPDSPIAIVGEGPGKSEVYAGRPFVGKSGLELNKYISQSGLKRDNLYITNLFKTAAALDLNKIKADERKHWQDLLIRELSDTKAKVIVACGKYALDALIGHQNIMARRGFVHVIKDGVLKGRKVMPMLHPAYTLREPKMSAVSLNDFKRAKAESKTKKPKYDLYKLITSPTHLQASVFLTNCIGKRVAVDIEGMGNITAMSFCCDGYTAISIPFVCGEGESYWSTEEELDITMLISRVLNESEIVGQNFLYDAYHLHHFGFINAKDRLWTNLKFDTLSAHIAAGMGELPHSLEFLASVYCNLPYWKEDGKEWKFSSVGSDPDALEEFWRYSAMDALATYKIAIELQKELEDMGTEDVFKRFYIDLMPHLLQIALRGIAVDENARSRLRKAYEHQLKQAEARLPLINGAPLNVKSPKQKLEFLRYYGITATNTDKETLKNIKKKKDTPAFIVDNLEAIEEVTKLRDIISRYLVAPLGHDGRYHFSLKPTTKTGRLASSKDPFGYGFNSQNITMAIREMIVPDPGMVLIYADLANAENRIVADLAHCVPMIKMFQSGEDFHCLNAANLFGYDTKKFLEGYANGDPEMKLVRKRGKMSSHAYNYDVGKYTLAGQAEVSLAEAERFLQYNNNKYPEIRKWQHKIRQQVMNTRILTNPFGRKRMFFDEYGIGLYHEAYAQIPQSTVPDIINLGLIELNKKYQVLTQVHDAILFQCKPDEMDDAIALCRRAMTEPIEAQSMENKLTGQYPALTLEIPVEFEISMDNWKDVKAIAK